MMIKEAKEEATYDMRLLVLKQIRHQKELEKMAESLTLDELEALSALELLKQPVFLEEITISLTQEEEDDEEEGEEEEGEAVNEEQHKRRKVDESQKRVSSQTNKKERKKRQHVEIEDSAETLRDMLNWKDNTPDNPPRRIFSSDPDVMGECSKPMRKQLMASDVKENQCRLMLGKDPVNKMMADVLEQAEKYPGKSGLKVSVYGPDGEIHEMLFKMWSVDTPVLTSLGWLKFVRRYELEPHRYFLTIWMFRHKETREICFAIDSTRFCVRGKLSSRILKAAF